MTEILKERIRIQFLSVDLSQIFFSKVGIRSFFLKARIPIRYSNIVQIINSLVVTLRGKINMFEKSKGREVATKAYPPPLKLIGHNFFRNFFSALKNVIFS